MDQAEWQRLLGEVCPDLLSAHSADGRFLFASESSLAVLGCSRDALLNQDLFALVHAEDAAVLRLAWNGILGGQGSGRARYRVRIPGTPDAETYAWVETTLARVASETEAAADVSAVTRVACSTRRMLLHGRAHDSTGATLPRGAYSEPETVESAATHRDHLVAMLPGMVWYGPVSPDLSRYRVKYMSRYLEKVAGYTPEEWIHTPGFWNRIIHPEDRELALRSARAAFTGEAEMLPYRMLTRDGRAIWVQSFVTIERDANGTPVHMHGLTLDVTMFKEAELRQVELMRRANELRERIDAVVGNVPGIVWERWEPGLAGARRQSFCSEFLTRLTGYPRADWEAREGGWLDFMPPADREAAAARWQQMKTEGQGETLQHRIVARNGDILWLENHIAVVRDGSGQVVALRGVALDITAEKRLEEERAQLLLENQLQAERIAELSTPLIPITDKIVVMPLIGEIDQTRAEQILHSLLRGVAAARAQIAILDVTGVAGLDAISGNILLRAAAALRLIGTQAILTGIRSDVAQTLVRMGVPLDSVVTRSSLQQALGELLRPGAAPKTTARPRT